jgi:metallo-beta-lactamase family protein
MAPHTLGRRLADQDEVVKIFGETYNRRCEVATLNGFSAHAGQDALIDYAMNTWGTTPKVLLVHGEARGAEPLMAKLNERGIRDVNFPEPHSSWEL